MMTQGQARGTPDLPGFADPVTAAQSTFRAVLDAFASPGRIVAAGAGLCAPAPLDQAAAAVLLTLVDGDAPLWLDQAVCPASDWLRFHCGASLTGPDSARFGCALGLPALDLFCAGSDEAPEDGATLVVQVAALGSEGEGAASYRLDGPGLRSPTPFAVSGLPPDFAARWAANHALFPRGVDLILCSGSRLAALPRSVTVLEA